MAPPLTHLLAVNSGSSSIKFALFACEGAPVRRFSGAVSGIATPSATLALSEGHDRQVTPIGVDGASHVSAVGRIIAALAPRIAGQALSGVVHRIVHGGDRFDRAQRMTGAVVEELRRLIPLAPNHLLDELALIDAFTQAMPETPQFACFDTAFHHDLPALSRTLPVPALPGLRRYGFHGLSYAFLLSELERLAGAAAARGRVVLAHLGSGASVAAVLNRRCIDTSMGLTPTGGLVMSSRSGDLDPGVVMWLAQQPHMSAGRLDDLLTRQSGLLGISGRSGDMRELLTHEDADPRARLAVDIFCYQARKWIGAFVAALGGVDTIVFAGGIGEHAAIVRERICGGLSFLGLELDPDQNAAHAPVISRTGSRVTVRVIATDEALMMAREALALVRDGRDPTVVAT